MLTPISEPAGWSEFVDSGMLWAVNRGIFHPTGVALAIITNQGPHIGWQMVAGDRLPRPRNGSPFEPITFDEETDRDGGDKFGRFMLSLGLTPPSSRR